MTQAHAQAITATRGLCRAVIQHMPLKVACAPQAHAYAQALLNGSVEQAAAQMREPLPEAYRTQLLYISSNLSYWRGEAAQCGRAECKRLIKALEA